MTSPLRLPTEAINELLLEKRTISVEVAGVLVAVITVVSPTALRLISVGVTVIFVARWRTVNDFVASFLPLFLDRAVTVTFPGAVGLSLPVVKPMVATFLLETFHFTYCPSSFRL